MTKASQAAFAVASQTSASAWASFKWLHIPLTLDKQTVGCNSSHARLADEFESFGHDKCTAKHC